MKILLAKFGFFLITILLLGFSTAAQNFQQNLTLTEGGTLEIVNNFGRIEVAAAAVPDEKTVDKTVALSAGSVKSVSANELLISNVNGLIRIEVVPNERQKRIDLSLSVPARLNLKLQTDAGEIRVSGNFASVEARTETGTISADVPLDDVRYNFLWTASRPRFLSDVGLEKVKEKNAGKFVLSGNIAVKSLKSAEISEPATADQTTKIEENSTEKEANKKNKKKSKPENSKSRIPNPKSVMLNFTTARGIILLNVNPNEVPSDLRERPLTEAAKAIIRSGDSLLTEAIRRASPKYFGQYAATLPPLKLEPRFTQTPARPQNPNSNLKKVLVRVTDLNNRAVSDLKKADFQVTEAGNEREVLTVEPTTAPFNLVLLLDVSGSVENYVDFIRKAARAFIETADRDDRIAIIIFNEDVKQLSTFTTDKGKLSESLDTFDAGGGTSYYDAVAFTLTETLRPLRGERTALVILTDGDDNHSFLPFDALLGSIQESGALIYPLYVPSTLIAASKTQDFNKPIDTVRTRYMGLTTKAEGEGEKLAQISGGVYYPITQLSQIQKAYDDIVLQLRTAYSVTFKSDMAEITDKTTASPRLKVRVKRENAFVKLGPVIEVKDMQSTNLSKEN